MKKTIILSLVFLIFSFTKVFACSCYKKSVTSNFKASDIVFTGKVIDIIKHKVIDSTIVDGNLKVKKNNLFEFKFEVKKFFKGEIDSKFVSIYTSGGITDCGNYFPIRSKQLVYAFTSETKLNKKEKHGDSEQIYSTSLCTQTKDLKKVKSKEFRKIKKLSRINH